MTNFAGKEEKSAPATARDTIQIMRDVFEPEQLQQVIACLQEDGYCCAIFEDVEGLRSVINESRTSLLFVGATSKEELAELVSAIRFQGGRTVDIPVLLYFKGALQQLDALLLPEIDEFLLDPLNLDDMRLRVRRLLQQNRDGLDEVEQVKMSLISHFGLRQFIGKSPAFVREIEKIPRVAASGATVLLIGDTGSGKEMCARAIHYLSPRAKKPFIPVNCGSIPADLFENEMFGHDAGAFTDARQARRGLIAEAEGGTLFLDEVDSLPLSAQVKLLRFLQDRQYRPLGATGFRQSDTRLVVASNQNLLQKVRDGKFREDLYYRLKVVSLNLPSLRNRREDIVPLALHFLKTSAYEYQRPVVRFSHDAMQKLMTYAWPGNVRELENVVRQAVVFADGPVLRAHDIHLSSDIPQTLVMPAKESFKEAKARVVEAFERSYLSEMVAACGGNISRAAREAQKDRRAFFALLKKHGFTSNYQDDMEAPHGYEETMSAAAVGM